MFSNFAFWSLILNGLVLVVTSIGFLKIMKNDLTHVQKSLDNIDGKVDDLVQRVSTIEGRLKASRKK